MVEIIDCQSYHVFNIFLWTLIFVCREKRHYIGSLFFTKINEIIKFTNERGQKTIF
jgi:hypothetical protein